MFSMTNMQRNLACLLAVLALTGCTERSQGNGADVPGTASSQSAVGEAGPDTQGPAAPGENEAAWGSSGSERIACTNNTPLRMPLFGDLHVHTALSFDAVAARIDTMPEDAYRFAKGEAISFFPQDDQGNPASTLQIDRPLDFLAVTDHADLLGETELCANPDSAAYDAEFCVKYREIEFRGALMMATVLGQENPKRIGMLCGEDGAMCRDNLVAPWQHIINAAEAANDRTSACTFTSFIAYEYTGSPGRSNYHRNVIFRNSSVPAAPISYVEAPWDSELWNQLDAVCGDSNGCDYLTIPHNSNMSNGKLLTPYARLEPTLENRTRYATTRLNREPLMEIFQHKGGSECINGLQSVLGATDELCDTEQVRIFGETSRARGFHLEGAELVMHPEVQRTTTDCGEGLGTLGMVAGGCISSNDFLRSALINGMEEEQEIGLNPIKLGVIASTDGHTGTPGSTAEDNWRGYVSGEMTIENRLKAGTLPSGIKGNPGGLAGVWAVENSRDAIFDAMKRRETFGTSGSRIVPRFFGGWDYEQDSCDRPDMVERGYAGGIPMGGDLPAPPTADALPKFVLAAYRDPIESAAPLQQLQIIKGWIDSDGQHHTGVFSVAGTPENGAGVDFDTGERFGEGHASLCAVFEDSDFDPSLPAYYYLRAVENPSPRWSLYDCRRLDESERPEVCSDRERHIIQEMAWSSPIWYTPGG